MIRMTLVGVGDVEPTITNSSKVLVATSNSKG